MPENHFVTCRLASFQAVGAVQRGVIILFGKSRGGTRRSEKLQRTYKISESPNESYA